MDQLLGGALDREPRVGVGRRHLGHRGHAAHRSPAGSRRARRRGGPGGRRPTGGRSGTPGRPRGRPRPGGTAPRTETAADRGRGGSTPAFSPAFFSRRLVSRASAPQMTPTSTSPARIAVGQVVDEDLRRGPPDARVEPVGRVDGQRLGQPAGRVVVLPALAVDDLQAADRREHVPRGLGVARPRRGRPAPTSPAARGTARRSGRETYWATPMTHGARGSTATRLLALPDRRALLGEGLRALLGVLAAEDPDPARTRSCRPPSCRWPGPAARSPWWPGRPADRWR